MAVNRSPAPEVQDVAERIIGLRHKHLAQNDVRIEYRFRDDRPKAGGQEEWAGLMKVGGWNAVDEALARGIVEQRDDEGNVIPPTGYFRLWVSKPIWDELKPEEREALVDWCLCQARSGHAESSGRLILSTLAPDLKVYFDNLRAYGAWHEKVATVVAMIAANSQQALPLEDKPEEGPPSLGTMAYNTPVGPSDVEANFETLAKDAEAQYRAGETRSLAEVEASAPVAFVTMGCGHEMAQDEYDKGLPCPSCGVQEGLQAVNGANGTNGNGKHEGEEPKQIIVPKGGRRKKTEESEAVA